MTKRVLLLSCMLLCAICNLQAVYFRHLGMKDGLSHISVMSIYQDELGRMWFGTEEGLNVYDGNGILSYKHTEDSIHSSEIPIGNHNHPIVGDRKGNIYFRSDGKLMHYDIRQEKFRCLKSENVLAVFCRDSTVLVSANDTVYEWDSRKQTFRYILNTNVPGHMINTLFVDSRSWLWIGTDRGLYLRKGGDDVQCIVPAEHISGMAEDSRSVVWIATRENGMYRSDRTGHLTKYEHSPDEPNSIPHNQVRSFTEDNYGNIWIGTFAGLCKYNPITDRYTTYSKDDLPGSLEHSSVFSTFKDRQGSIWVGTYYGGVHVFNPEMDPFTHYSAGMTRDDCLNHFFVGKMAEDKNRNLWICTEGGGLNFFDRKHKTFRHFPSGGDAHTIAHNNLKCITYSPKYDRLYIGTHTGGLSVYDIKNGRIHNLRDRRSDSHRQIGDVVIRTKLYGEDTLIIHSRRGLFAMDLATEQVRPLFDLGIPATFSVFFIDSKGYIWLANSSAIVKIKISDRNDRQTFDRKENGLGTFEVSCIFEDSGGRLFFGTLGSGLYGYDGAAGRFTGYTAEKNLLLSNYCYDIVRSEQNELIVFGDRGLSFLDINGGKLRTVSLDALIFSGVNKGNGLLVCGNGEIFVSGIGGLTSFFEQEVFNINKDYDIYFSSLSVNSERIMPGDRTGILSRALPFTDRIVLKHNRNNILIHFASNNYINPYEQNSFEYRLEGFDDRWMTGNNVRYTNLRPGKYHLMVREKSAEPAIISKTIAMDIVVRHPWYANPFAYALYVIIAYFIVFSFLRFRRIRLYLMTSLEMERRDRERIEQLNDAKLQFFSNISHEFHTPLTLISVQIERLLNGSSISPFVYNKLLRIGKQTAHLRNLISELLDFRKLEQGYIRLKVREQNLVPFLKEIYLSFYEMASTRNITYTFCPAAGEINGWFDPKQMRKVFYNLLSNAFKYTRNGDTVELSVEETADAVRIKVMDSGIGIDREDIDKIFDRFYQVDNSAHNLAGLPGTGIGLSVVKGILELHHGAISVESKPSYGSIFIVTLRKGNGMFGKEELAESHPGDRAAEACSAERDAACVLLPEMNATVTLPQEILPEEGKKYTVLIVEDNGELRHVLQDIFRPMYNVMSACDGREGLRLARQEKPDLVVSDIVMPNMSGTELCTAIKNDFETCHIPVVLLTALSSAEHNIAGFQHGADDYISKPFEEKTLIARCNNLIRNRIIIRSKFGKQNGPDVQSLSNNPIDQKFLDTIIRIIDSHSDNPDFSINLLARELNISRSSLYSKFEALTGMTPNDFVLQRKLRKAADLLRNNPEMNVSEIADMTGFGSPRYFSRCFKKQFNVSPVEYRKKSFPPDELVN
ncbi:MAG: response regulator [Tannerella sp.]|jgi:signal transduction histidine kinase/ligand-binding sensor domain-containing protein/DNA-binding response OmpR family regulator|nr:response regulator [Tannerella sp.]